MPALQRSSFQKQIDGKQADLFVMRNNKGVEICATNYGARIVSWLAPDRGGNMEDIVLGYESVQDYIDSKEPYFGAAIGRFGNRIANGKFTLDGVEYTIPINNAPNALHGGPAGFQSIVWDARQVNPATVEFRLLSKDGDQGFPGNLAVTMTYALTDDNELKISYRATTDKPTVINLTHHSFFNLHGAGNGSVNDHILTINADNYTPVSSALIPTGEMASVSGTPMDFRQPTVIGARVDADFEQLKNGAGYDHNWVLNKPGGGLQFAAKIIEPKSGRVLEVRTTEPGMQFYGGNFLNASLKGKGGKTYDARTAFCFETQHFPDSPNQKNFPSTVLRPGETYTQECVYKFYAE
ncbi:aldose 1-epimerase [Ereboglobus sp. PH5-5]|uniref:aldose epimerase family protein n=1 Tax=Ereboglobus sp. PH5-5 TaxID=2940529 RepID=UPI002406B2FA|nr:aldose epimerase family protein [Ereboglobus sp. PH5-5]MDF9832295.1 aldose 1-epimerase [Ereboglobus sp. PH5-5]